MSGPVTPFKSPNDGKQITRGASSQDMERDKIAGKALFTSPVLKEHIPLRSREPVEEAHPTLDRPQPEDAVGKSPTAEMFATPPLHVRWKKPRQQGSGSTHAVGSLPSGEHTEQPILNAASTPQDSDMWLSGKPQRDLFSTPNDQMVSTSRRKVVDFGDLVVEGLRAQGQHTSEETRTPADTGGLSKQAVQTPLSRPSPSSLSNPTAIRAVGDQAENIASPE